MKLQKLVYYCQAWSLVWDEAPMFDNRIEAWANGPVVPDLYAQHKGLFMIETWHGNANDFSECEAETIEAVVDHYAKYTAQQLSDLTHSEAPWREAREGLLATERGSQEISQAALAEFYGGL